MANSGFVAVNLNLYELLGQVVSIPEEEVSEERPAV